MVGTIAFETEKSLHNPNHPLKIVTGLPRNRIIFAKVKSPLSDVMHRFKIVDFHVISYSLESHCFIFRLK